MAQVALVTGGNKGIGKEIARKLGAAGVVVVLGCQCLESGEVAAQELRTGGCEVVCARLELREPSSVAAVRELVAAKFGRLDILVNNAAICFNDPTLYGTCKHTPFEQQAGITVHTNFFGTLDVTQAMLPLLRASPSPRVVTVASHAGRLAILKSQQWVDAFTASDLQLAQLETMMRSFVVDVESGCHASKGWPNTCYGLSKLGLIALTKLLARDEPTIMINCMDPGYCATDQNANQGTTSAEHGARTAAWLALRPASSFVSGKYWMDEREKPW